MALNTNITSYLLLCTLSFWPTYTSIFEEVWWSNSTSHVPNKRTPQKDSKFQAEGLLHFSHSSQGSFQDLSPGMVELLLRVWDCCTDMNLFIWLLSHGVFEDAVPSTIASSRDVEEYLDDGLDPSLVGGFTTHTHFTLRAVSQYITINISMIGNRIATSRNSPNIFHQSNFWGSPTEGPNWSMAQSRETPDSKSIIPVSTSRFVSRAKQYSVVYHISIQFISHPRSCKFHVFHYIPSISHFISQFWRNAIPLM